MIFVPQQFKKKKKSHCICIEAFISVTYLGFEEDFKKMLTVLKKREFVLKKEKVEGCLFTKKY